jgi:hypothetical protein
MPYTFKKRCKSLTTKILTTSPTPTTNPILDISGLSLFYDLSNSSKVDLNAGNISKLYDQSTNLNHAEQSNATLQPVYTNPYASFDGSDDRLVAPNHSSITFVDKLSFAIKFKLSSSLSISTYIFSKNTSSASDNEYGLRFSNTFNNLQFYIRSSSKVETITPISKNVLYKLICTWDGSSVKIYLNGTLDNSSTFAETILSNTGTLNLARINDSTPSPFRGDIYSLAIFNKALSVSEIATVNNSL